MAVSRTIADDDAVFFRRHVDKPADLEILDHAATAVQQDDRVALPALKIMDPYSVHIEEPSDRAVPTLGSPGKLVVHQRRDGKHPGRGNDGQCRTAGERSGSASRDEMSFCTEGVHDFHPVCTRHVSNENVALQYKENG